MTLAYSRVNRAPEAVALVQPFTDAPHEAQTWARGHVLVALSDAYLTRGRVVEAAPLAEHALGHAQAHRDRGNEAWALRLLGDVAARRDADEVAERYYQQALTLATELGMRPLVAHCHLGLGKLYRRTGDQAKAQDHLTTAITMYREMDMAFWLKKGEAVLAGVER